MNEKEKYIKQIQNQMDKYKNKISKIDDFLRTTQSSNKSELVAQRQALKDKFDQGEAMLNKIQSSSEDAYKKIKENAAELFEEVKEAFHEFSHFLTMEQLYRVKDEVIDFGHEKLDKVQCLVKNHPVTMAICAIGIGFLMGALLTRSK